MQNRTISVAAAMALMALLLAACVGAPTPTPTTIPTPAPTMVPKSSSQAPAPASEFETQSNSGGSVTVDVKPTALVPGAPVAFDIAMNTHSVELDDDMVKISILRDDAGNAYRSTGWEGDGGGGHHRSGTLAFPAPSGRPKYVELVIKGLADIPERVFKWNVP